MMWRRSALAVFSVVSTLVLSTFLCAAEAEPAKPAANPAPLAPVATLVDPFDLEKLDADVWLVTRRHDFAEFAVDVAPCPAPAKGRRLRLRCGTIGTDDKTVKFLGVVSRAPLDLTGRKRLALEFDWNSQINGCYLTGAVVLCPTLTEGNPQEEPDWVKLEYVGVPPGKNARAAVWQRDRKRLKWLYTEGWPREQRKGRLIGKVTVELLIADGQWTVVEGGKALFTSAEGRALPFKSAYLYLQMSSHSNYPARELFFDNVSFGVVPEPEKPKPE